MKLEVGERAPDGWHDESPLRELEAGGPMGHRFSIAFPGPEVPCKVG